MDERRETRKRVSRFFFSIEHDVGEVRDTHPGLRAALRPLGHETMTRITSLVPQLLTTSRGGGGGGDDGSGSGSGRVSSRNERMNFGYISEHESRIKPQLQ